MANIHGIEGRAGEGNRTPVVSLGSVRSHAILPIFARKIVDQSASESRTFREQAGCLPQLYRNGPETRLQPRPALTTRRGDFA